VKYERERQLKRRLKRSWLERKEKNLERISGPVVAPDVSRDPNPPISARMIQHYLRALPGAFGHHIQQKMESERPFSSADSSITTGK
jgi:hypothetical protein